MPHNLIVYFYKPSKLHTFYILLAFLCDLIFVRNTFKVRMCQKMNGVSIQVVSFNNMKYSSKHNCSCEKEEITFVTCYFIYLSLFTYFEAKLFSQSQQVQDIERIEILFLLGPTVSALHNKQEKHKYIKKTTTTTIKMKVLASSQCKAWHRSGLIKHRAKDLRTGTD